MLGDEMAKGDSRDPKNLFAFDHVRLNLPGAEGYSPSLPWVSKVDLKTGKISADVKIYVDDKRVTAPSKALCDQATRRAASFLNYLGEQDACRKRVPASCRAGAWAGSVCHTDSGCVTVMVTVDKWSKAREYVVQLLAISTAANTFEFKELESIRGFLIYIIRTYPAFTPYLKGIHLTLDSWRSGRGEDGWKHHDVAELTDGVDDVLHGSDASPPTHVTGVPRLQQDLQALATLFEPVNPPRRVVRSQNVLVVLYGYGDASRTGFGSCFVSPSGTRIRYGLWGRVVSHQSSNFRELRNLADALECELADQFPVLREAVNQVVGLVQRDDLSGIEIFLFIDNIVAKCAFFRGTSSNPLLFDIILRLKQLELTHSVQLHVVHIAGTRMMEQGTDGLSRGSLWEGSRVPVCVPLHLSPLERDPSLESWFESWTPFPYLLRPLSHHEWFTTGHGIIGWDKNTDGFCTPVIASPTTVFLWHPAPAAAEAALEELCMSRHKRPSFAHIFACPRLFTHTWRKRLFKYMDFTFNLSAGFLPHVWGPQQHEPLVIGVFLPFRDHPPWLHKHSPSLVTLEHRLRQAFAMHDTALHQILVDLWFLH